jgi:hypothetical protein
MAAIGEAGPVERPDRRAEVATTTGVIGPAEYPGLEEGAIDDQLTAAFK